MVDGAKSNLTATSSGNLLTANTVYFINPAGSMSWGTTEAHHQHRVRRYDMKYSNAYIEVSSNGITAPASTVVSRNNNADGNMSILIPSSATGNFEDVVNSDTVTNGNYFGWKFTPGAATGQMGFRAFICTQTPLGTATVDIAVTKFMATQVNQTVLNTATASVTGYICIHGETSAAGTTEAASQITVRKAGTLYNLEAYVSANARTTPTTYTIRKNLADTIVTLSVGSTATGIFEDLTNSVSVAVGDEINYKLVTGTGAQNLNLSRIGVLFESTDRITILSSGATPGMGVNANVTTYVAVAGRATANTTESIPQISTGNWYQVTNLGVNVSANTVTLVSTVRFRINANNGNLAASITLSTTGIFEDVSSTDNVIGTDQINYQIVTGATGTALTVRTITCHARRAAPVLYQRNATEAQYTVADTETLKMKRFKTETGYSLADTEILKLKRFKTETGFSVSDTEILKRKYLKTESGYSVADTRTLKRKYFKTETGYSLDDAVTIKRNRKRALVESVGIITDAGTKAINIFRTETGYSLSDTVTSKIKRRRTLAESVGIISDAANKAINIFKTEPGYSITDTVLIKRKFVKLVTELGYGLTDTAAIKRLYPRTQTETGFSVTDTYTRKIKRSLTETAYSVLDTVIKKIKMSRSEASYSVSEDQTLRIMLKRFTSEPGYSVSEADLLKIKRVKQEPAYSVNDTNSSLIIGYVRRFVTETGYFVADTVKVRLRRSLAETIGAVSDAAIGLLKFKVTVTATEGGYSVTDAATVTKVKVVGGVGAVRRYMGSYWSSLRR